MNLTMTLEERIALKKSLFKKCEKQAIRYAKLHQTYAKKYEEQRQWNNRELKEIEQLEAQLYQLKKKEEEA
jgi:hypothetical protein